MRKSACWCIKAAALLGLAFGVAGPVAAEPIVQNGNFATGDFSGWTLSGGSSGSYVSGPPSTGPFAAALTTDTTGDGFLSQGLTLFSGTTYTVSFDLTSDGYTPNSLSASLGGTTLVSLTSVPDVMPSYTTYTYSYTTTMSTSATTSALLSFDFLDDPGYLYLTNISVVAVPSAVPEPPAVLGLSLGVLMVMGFARLKHRNSKEGRFARA